MNMWYLLAVSVVFWPRYEPSIIVIIRIIQSKFQTFTPARCKKKIKQIQKLIFIVSAQCFITNFISGTILWKAKMHGENFMAIFTTLSVVIWFSTGTLGIFFTLVYVFTMRVVIYDILNMATTPTLSTSILFCNFCYIQLWILLRSVVKIVIRI